MAKQGYIKLYRQLQECWIWNDDEFSKGQAWIDLLLSCNHEDKKISFDGKPCVVQRGEWLTSILGLSVRWKWGRKKVSNFLDVLESDGMIVQNRNNKRTLIKVVNYEVYQAFDNQQRTTEEHQENNNGTTEEHQGNTNNNDKECNKNDKEDNMGAKSTRFVPPTLEEVKSYCLERKNNVNAENFINFYSSKGWMVGKNKMKDWKAAVRTWETNSNNKKGNANGSDTRNGTEGYEYDSYAKEVFGV